MTTITDQVAAAPTTINPNGYVLTAAAGVNRIQVQNFAGSLTIHSGDGADQITVYTGGGGSVTLADSASATTDNLIVRTPQSVRADVTVGATSITAGSDTISYDATVGSISLVGQLFGTGDNLTVNGSSSAEAISVGNASIRVGTGPTVFYSTFAAVAVNGGGGADVITVSGAVVPTTVSGGTGNAQFVVNANAVDLTLNGGTGSSTFTINANSGTLIVNGGTGNNSFSVQNSSSQLTLVGGTGTNTYTVAANSGNLVVTGGGLANRVTVNGNSGTVGVAGGAGTDAFTVNSTTGAMTLSGGTGTTTYLISAPPTTPVTVVGNSSGVGTLTFRGTTLADNFAVSPTTLFAGTGGVVTYSNLSAIRIEGLDGSDGFTVSGVNTPLTMVGGAGTSTYNVRANTRLTTIDSTGGAGIVNLGSVAPGTGGVASNLSGGVVVTGDADDTLNIDDSGNSSGRNVLVSTTQVTGIGAGTFSYSGVGAINLALGSGADTVTMSGSPVAAFGINLGAGANVAVVGVGNLNSVSGTVTFTGSGADALTLDDTGSATAKTGVLGAGSLTGLLPGTVNFTGMSTVGLGLGSGGNTLEITGTQGGAITTVNGGSGVDTLTLDGNGGETRLNIGVDDLVAIKGTSFRTTVTATGTSSVVVGAPAGLVGITGAVRVVGSGSDALTVDGSGASAGVTGVVTGTVVSGLGMGASVTYSGVTTLWVSSGSGDDSVTVSSTAGGAVTMVSSGGGNDAVNVESTTGALTVNVGTGMDVVAIGAGTRTLSSIAGAVTMNGNGATLLSLDDAGNAAGGTGVVTSTDISGFGMAGVTYAAVAGLDVRLGAGADNVSVRGTSGLTRVDAGGGTNAVVVGSAAPGTGGTLAGIVAGLNITSGGTGSLVVDDAGDATGRSVTVTGTTVTGASPAAITYGGLTSLTVGLGSGGNSVVVTGTHAGDTTVSSTGGNDVFHVKATTGALTVNPGFGNNTTTIGDDAHLMSEVAGTVTVNGVFFGSDVLSLDDSGDTVGRTVTMTPTQVTGPFTTVNFNGVGTLTVSLGSGADTAYLAGTSVGVNTTLDLGGGDDVANVQAITSSVTVVEGTGRNTVNVGSNVPGTGNVLSTIGAALTVTGGGDTALNLDDGADGNGRAATLTATSFAESGTGPISFSGVSSVTLTLGSDSDAVTISGTVAGPTTVNTGAGADTVTVTGSTGALTINDGGGADTITVPVTGNLGGGFMVAGNTSHLSMSAAGAGAGVSVVLTGTTITGMSASPTTYSGLATLDLTLSGFADSLVVSGTASGTVTSVDLGAGDDVAGVLATSSATTIVGGTGTNTISVGSAGLLGGVAGPLTVTGGGADTVTFDDSSNTSAVVAVLTGTSFSAGSATTTFSGVGTLGISLGSGRNTVTVAGTPTGATTTLSSGSGADGVTVLGNAGPTTVNAGDGADVITVAGTGATLAVVTGAGSDVVRVLGTGAGLTVTNTGDSDEYTLASSALTTGGIAGPVTLSGSGTDSLLVDDSGNTSALSSTSTVTVTPTTIAGLTGGDVTLGGIGQLAVNLGGGHTVNVNGTLAGPKTIRAGAGTSVITVDLETGPLTLDLTAGRGVVNVLANGGDIHILDGTLGSTVTLGAATRIGPVGNVNVTGGGHTILHLDLENDGSTTGKTLTLTSSSVTGAFLGNVLYSGVQVLTLGAGGGPTNLTIASTFADTITTVSLGMADDVVTVPDISALAGTTSVDGAGGSNALHVTDAGTTPHTLTVTASSVRGAGATLSYSNFKILSFDAGAGVPVSITSVPPGSTVSAGGAAAVTYTGDLSDTLNLTGAGQSVSISGNLTGTVVVTGSLSALTVGGALSGTFAATGSVDAVALGSLTGGLHVDGSLPAVTINGNLSGSLSAGKSMGTVLVFGNLSGTVTAGTSLGTVAVAGSEDGTISGATVGTVEIGAGVPMAGNGRVLNVVEAGATYAVFARTAAGTGATGVTFKLSFDGGVAEALQQASLLRADEAGDPDDGDGTGDGSTDGSDGGSDGGVGDGSGDGTRGDGDNDRGDGSGEVDPIFETLGAVELRPSVAMRVSGVAVSKYDVLVSAAGDKALGLSRFDSTTGAATSGVRNIGVDGGVGLTLTAGQVASMGVTVGGISLPSEDLQVVSARDDLETRSILSRSLAGLAFSTISGPEVGTRDGMSRTARQAAVFNHRADLLGYALVLGTGKKPKPIAKLTSPPTTVKVEVAEGGETGLFVKAPHQNRFGEASYFRDDADDGTQVSATIIYNTRAAGGRWIIDSIGLSGAGASVDTTNRVSRIFSSQTVEDIVLRAGRGEKLTLEVLGITGTVRLFGGKIISQGQLTPGS